MIINLFVIALGGSTDDDHHRHPNVSLRNNRCICARAQVVQRTNHKGQRAGYPNLHVMSTVDLLLSSLITDAFDANWLSECSFNALSIARMRVPDHHRDQLCSLLGPERLRCRSLPTAWRELTDSQSATERSV